MRRSPKVASFIHKHFEALSWMFIILTLASIVGVAYGGYNFYLYGNCNGPQLPDEDPGFCIFDPTGTHQLNQVSTCGNASSTYNLPKLIPPTDLTEMKTFGNQDSGVTFVMFGCYSCEYTRKASATYFELYDGYKDSVKFVYVDFPLAKHSLSFESSMIGTCIYDKDKESYMSYSREIFTAEGIFTSSEDQNTDYLQRLSNLKALSSKYLSPDEVEACLSSQEIKDKVQQQINIGKASNVYGTPTFFINGEGIVGPRPKKAFTIILDEQLR